MGDKADAVTNVPLLPAALSHVKIATHTRVANLKMEDAGSMLIINFSVD